MGNIEDTNETYSLSEAASAIGVSRVHLNKLLRVRKVLPEPDLVVGATVRYSHDGFVKLLWQAAKLRTEDALVESAGRPRKAKV